ncbi:MAG: hypothetical protein Tsb0016_22630 [Sphingomonadales bacterium]
MFDRKNLSWLSLVAVLVATTPLGSTGAPESILDHGMQLGLRPMNAPVGGTVTDLHLIAFSRDIGAH